MQYQWLSYTLLALACIGQMELGARPQQSLYASESDSLPKENSLKNMLQINAGAAASSAGGSSSAAASGGGCNQ